MSDYLPEAVRKGLQEARRNAQRLSNKLCVHDGDRVYRVLRMWGDGFALAAEGAPRLRGHVDLYDGHRHLYQCLVITSRDEADERIFEFKWHTPALDAPPVDFVRTEPRPSGLLARPH